MQLSGLSENTKARILEFQESVAIAQPVGDRQPLPSVGRSGHRTQVATLERMEDGQPAQMLAFGGFYDFVAKVQPDRDDDPLTFGSAG